MLYCQSKTRVDRSDGAYGFYRQHGLSTDGRKLLTGDSSGAVILWDAATGDKLRTFHGWSAALSGDGSSVLTVDYESPLLLRYSWPQDWRLLQHGTEPTMPRIRLWDASSGACLRSIRAHREHVRPISAAMSNDGRRALSYDYTTVILWDLGTGQKLRRFKITDEGVLPVVSRVAMSGNGRRMLTGLTGLSDNTVILWDLATGEKLRTVRHPRELGDVALSHDGTKIVTAGSQWATTDATHAVLWEGARAGNCKRSKDVFLASALSP